jgi:hypothetical protein
MAIIGRTANIEAPLNMVSENSETNKTVLPAFPKECNAIRFTLFGLR